MTRPLTQNFTNGWTFSVAPDLSGVGFTVAAYPTPGSPFAGTAEEKTRTWFTFKNGQDEQRVFSFGAAMVFYKEVEKAKPPSGRTP